MTTVSLNTSDIIIHTAEALGHIKSLRRGDDVDVSENLAEERIVNKRLKKDEKRIKQEKDVKGRQKNK